MNWAGGIVVFVVVWWCVFLAALPWGVRGLHETGDVRDGCDPGAPSNPHLGLKALVTTGSTILIWLVIYWLISSGLIDLRRVEPF